ncbi:MAG: PAS domain S-box protein [Candidatus Aureabacteria bacterium]|nr:PAS domain S-box protein [Candidatus Auribacterota bacterium]
MKRDSSGRRYLVVAGVLIAGIALSCALFFMARNSERNRLESEIRVYAIERTALFRDAVNDHIDLLYSLRSLYLASKKVERAEFGVFVLGFLEEHPDVLAFDWIPRVLDADRAKFEETARGEGLADFQIKERGGRGQLSPAIRRPVYYPIYYVEPFAQNKFLLGFDELSDPVRQKAMEKARDSGEPVATERIRLIREPRGGFACRVFMAVYLNDAPCKTREERRENLIGFISILFKIGEVLESSLKDLSPRDIDSYVYDGTSPQRRDLLYYYCGSRLRSGSECHTEGDLPPVGALQFQDNFVIAGRTWIVVSTPCTEFLKVRGSWRAWNILFAGLVVTSLLGIYLTEILGRESKVRLLVDERTTELRKSNEALAAEIEERARAQQMLAEARERLAVTLNSIGDGMIATDMRGVVTLLNRIAQELTGWSEKEAVGKPLEEVFHIVNERTRARCPNPVERVLASGKIEGLANHTLLIARDGSERILADSAAPIRDREGSVIGVVLVFRDITEIRKIGQDLQKSEIKYKTLYDSSADAIMLATPEGGFLSGNGAATEMFGCRDEKEFISHSSATLSPERQPDGTLSSVKAQQMMAIAMEKGSHFFEWIHKRLDGREFFATVLLTRMEVEGKTLLQATVRDINERKRMEDALLLKTMLLESQSETSIDGILVVDSEGHCILSNRRFGELWKIPQHVLDTKDDKEMLEYIEKQLKHPEEFRAKIEHLYELRNEKIRDELEFADGRFFDRYSSPMTDAAGKYCGRVWYFRDITERKKTEEDLAWEAGINASLADLAEALITTGSIGDISSLVIERANRLTESLLGFACYVDPLTGFVVASSSAGDNRIEPIAKENSAAFREFGRLCGTVLSSKKPILINPPMGDAQSAPHPGEDVPIKRFLSAPAMFLGQPLGAVAVANSRRDYTDNDLQVVDRLAALYALAISRMRSEGEIKRAAEEWLKTFDAISDFVFIQDKEFTITKTNKAFARLLKRAPEEIVGKKCYELLHKRKEPWDECPFEITRKTKKPHTTVVDDPQIGIPLMVTTSPLFDKEGEFIGSVHLAKDITEALERESNLKDALEIKSQFVSMVSHELRTPLTAIKEGIGIVADGIAGKLNEKQKEFLDIAKKSVDRLARLINEVLDFQKLEAGKVKLNLRRNDLNEAVREVCRTMSPATRERGLDLATRIDETLPRVIFARDSIIQVLTNIVDNAIKYTEKGSITIATGRGDNFVSVEVSDTGPGIPREDLPKLFHSFERLDGGKYRKAGGTGLGLAISKQIIEKHNGKIWAESTPGKGMTIHFILPIEERRA